VLRLVHTPLGGDIARNPSYRGQAEASEKLGPHGRSLGDIAIQCHPIEYFNPYNSPESVLVTLTERTKNERE
jgi:hypothetical protein